MAKIAIVYFSGYGHTEKLAQAVEAGGDKPPVPIARSGEMQAGRKRP